MCVICHVIIGYDADDSCFSLGLKLSDCERQSDCRLSRTSSMALGNAKHRLSPPRDRSISQSVSELARAMSAHRPWRLGTRDGNRSKYRKTEKNRSPDETTTLLHKNMTGQPTVQESPETFAQISCITCIRYFRIGFSSHDRLPWVGR